jgi:SagB-type dehydrogenase family enzyme
MDIKDSIEAVFKVQAASSISLNDLNIGPLPQATPQAWTVRDRKDYPRLRHFPLRQPPLPSKALSSALAERQSVRRFKRGTLQLVTLEALLCAALKERPDETETRPYASAGARYPCEVYLGISAVEGLSDGLYFYNAHKHALVHLLDCNPIAEARHFAPLEEFGAPNILAVITTVLHRSLPKYAGRGYRYCLMECGEIAQTLALVSTVLGLGFCLLGGFDDRRLADWLDVSPDLELEVPLLVCVSGVPL